MHCSRTLRAVVTLLCLLACAANLAACGAGATRQSVDAQYSQEAAAGLKLPSPAELLTLRPGQPIAGPQQPSREVSEFSRLAFVYDFSLPNSRVSSSGTNLLMEPQYSPGGPLSGAAFCLYSFDFDSGEIDLSDTTLHLAESDLVQQGSPQNLYVLFPNYATNRWDAFNFSALPGFAGPADPTDYVPPVSASTFYFAVLAVGNQPYEFKRVRIGNDPPAFSVVAFPDTGQSPLDVDFLADIPDFGSEDFDTLEWDFEGDGTFELKTGVDVVEQSFQYTAAGTYLAALRVTDTEGLSHTEIATIVVSDNITRSWGGSGDENALGIDTDASGNVYICGRDSSNCLLLKFDSQLELLWSKAWHPADPAGFGEYRSLVCIGTEVFVAGRAALHDAAPHDYDIILHSYQADGTLSMQKTYGHTTEDDEAMAITTDGTDIYLTGYTWDPVDDGEHFLAAKIDVSGAVLWGKHDALLETAPFYNTGRAVALWETAGSVAFIPAIENEFAYTPACVVALDSADGTLNLQRFYTSDIEGQELVGKAMLTRGAKLTLVGNYDDGFDEGLFSFDIDAVGGAVSSPRFIDSIIGVSFGAAAADPTATASDSIVCGGGTTFDAALLYDSPAADPILFDQLDGPGSFTSQVYGLVPAGDGVYYNCGFTLFSAGTSWDRDSDLLDTVQPGTITAGNPGFVFEDWTPNAGDSAGTAADIAGTLDAGGGGEDMLVSRLVPGI